MKWYVGMLVLWVGGVLAIGSPAIAQITYMDDIQTIFQTSCGGCHGGTGTLNNFLDYNTAKNDVIAVLTRIRIPQGQQGHMPQGGGI